MINLSIEDEVLEDIDLMIFDKDGTLFELYPYWSTVAVKRAELICDFLEDEDKSLVEQIALIMGADLKNKRMNPQGPIGIYNRIYIQNLIYDELKKKGYGIEREMVQNAFNQTDAYIKNQDILSSSLVPVRGLIELLNDVRGQCKCAIFSYDLTNNLKSIVEMFKIEGCFNLLLGGDLIKNPKPDPWGAIKIMNELHVLPKNTALIGDSAFDIESGKSAECEYLITVASDISNLEILKPMSNAVIEDFTKIKVC
jgi:phosphoglycolate phosphatase